ncbi:DUF2844 domain-containing protein [Trinickia violacea]|uniref:DUF2844 domain-containing protein n=1 Tax=Trinickia violacea TaxID=2571746 RepID=A0A4P8IJQ5_9BURK|nr:DUF2844 domain-containing protein [Trinickia violacea]QCP47775.1 DUF2844 domain-containing protein [Trinickia violacea]
MPSRLRRAVLQASIAVPSSLFFMIPAHAVLGGNPMQTPEGATSSTVSPAVARAAVQGSSTSSTGQTTSSTSASYSVIQTTLSSGTVVREYVTQSGTVFGIAWSGPLMPNLTDLLGDYFPQFASGVQAARAAGVRGPGVVEQSGLVVHAGGHMGAFTGQAYLPQALPSGVAGSDIQ